MSDELSARWDELTTATYADNQPGHGVPEREPLLIERLRVAQTFGLGDQRLEDSHANLLHYYYCDSGDRRKVEVVCRYWMGLKNDQLTASRHDLFVLMELGSALTILGDNGQAERYYRRALALAEAEYGVGHRDTHGPLHQLAQHLHHAKQHDEAIALGERLRAMRAAEPPESWQGRTDWMLMLRMYQEAGRLAEAEALLRQEMDTVDERESEKDRDEPGRDMRPAMLLGQLADIVAEQGRLDEAIALKQESVTRISAAWDAMNARREKERAEMEAQGHKTAGPLGRGPDMHMRRSYAELLRRAGRLNEAEAEYRQLVVLQEADARLDRSWMGADTGRGSREIQAAQSACVRAEGRHPILAGLAAVLRAAGRDAEAEPLATEAARLKAGAQALRDRLWRIYKRRARLHERRELVSVEELRRLLATSIGADPSD